jgi:hypothetical protein
VLCLSVIEESHREGLGTPGLSSLEKKWNYTCAWVDRGKPQNTCHGSWSAHQMNHQALPQCEAGIVHYQSEEATTRFSHGNPSPCRELNLERVAFHTSYCFVFSLAVLHL